MFITFMLFIKIRDLRGERVLGENVRCEVVIQKMCKSFVNKKKLYIE